MASASQQVMCRRSAGVARAALRRRRPLPLSTASHPTCRQRAALVSKRFRELCCSPELLQEVETPYVRSLAALQSFLPWLARHGQHVRRLHLSTDPAPGAEEGSWAAALASFLAVAGAAGQLTEPVRMTAYMPTAFVPLRARIAFPPCSLPSYLGCSACGCKNVGIWTRAWAGCRL